MLLSANYCAGLDHGPARPERANGVLKKYFFLGPARKLYKLTRLLTQTTYSKNFEYSGVEEQVFEALAGPRWPRRLARTEGPPMPRRPSAVARVPGPGRGRGGARRGGVFFTFFLIKTKRGHFIKCRVNWGIVRGAWT